MPMSVYVTVLAIVFGFAVPASAEDRPSDPFGNRIAALGTDLATVWMAATTTPRDRKELLGTLIEEVIVKVERDKSAAHLTLRWKAAH
jgi:hypothetical protein